MLECLIVGDSIAVGVSSFRKECVSYSKSGINSKNWINKNIQHMPLQAKTVIISLGSNDHKGIKTESELETIRQSTKADRVFWILPAIKPNIQNTVQKIAERYGDTVLPITKLQTDGVHPSTVGYKELANASK